MMVAAVVGRGELALAVDGAAEFAPPDDQRVVEQAALLEIGDEGRRGAVGVAGLAGDLRGELRVLVPAAVEELDEPHAALGQPRARRQLAAKVPGLRTSGP